MLISNLIEYSQENQSKISTDPYENKWKIPRMSRVRNLHTYQCLSVGLLSLQPGNMIYLDEILLNTIWYIQMRFS